MTDDRIDSFAEMAEVEREGRELGDFLAKFIDARLVYRRILCGQPGCDLRADQPQAQCCVRADCPLLRKDAA